MVSVDELWCAGCLLVGMEHNSSVRVTSCVKVFKNERKKNDVKKNKETKIRHKKS